MSEITPQLAIARWFADADDPSEADMLNAREVIAVLRAAGYKPAPLKPTARQLQEGWQRLAQRAHPDLIHQAYCEMVAVFEDDAA